MITQAKHEAEIKEVTTQRDEASLAHAQAVCIIEHVIDAKSISIRVRKGGGGGHFPHPGMSVPPLKEYVLKGSLGTDSQT